MSEVSSAQSPLSAPEKAEAAQLLQQASLQTSLSFCVGLHVARSLRIGELEVALPPSCGCVSRYTNRNLPLAGALVSGCVCLIYVVSLGY